jgi:hypothetical protein
MRIAFHAVNSRTANISCSHSLLKVGEIYVGYHTNAREIKPATNSAQTRPRLIECRCYFSKCKMMVPVDSIDSICPKMF